MKNGLNKRSRVSEFVYLLPVFVFTLSILLVRAHLFSMPLTDIYWSSATDSSTITDLFNFWKAMAILCAGGLAFLFAVLGYFREQIRFKKSFLYVPALVYAAFVLISLAFSDYKYFALRGMEEHFEGTAVLLVYMVMVFFLFNAVDSERRLKMVVSCALIAVLILGILGALQATGNDFFKTAVGQKMISPNYILDTGVKFWDMIDMLAEQGQTAFSFTFDEVNQVYQTVYNPNYVPFYLILLLPVCWIFFCHGTGKETSRIAKVTAICVFVIYILALYSFICAYSQSGYFGLVAAAVTALIVFRKHLKKWAKPLLCLILVSALVFGVLADRWLPEVKGIFGEVYSSLFEDVYADTLDSAQFTNAPASVPANIEYFDCKDGCLLAGIEGSVLRIARDEEHSGFIITDGDGGQLYMTTIEGEEGNFQILDERFHDYIKLSMSKLNGDVYISILTNSTIWSFRYENGSFLYHNQVGKDVPLTIVDHSSLFSDYTFGSNRGLIWDTTIPMLKHYIFTGAGADTFTFVYPQNDYVTKYKLLGPLGLMQVTDKAHNLYMQYWVNTGLISLLAWLALVGYYLVGSMKSFRKRGLEDFSDYMNGGIFCGIIGFLFVALFSDGSVNTMPMFYTMLGTGLAVNAKDKWLKAEEAPKRKAAQMPEI